MHPRLHDSVVSNPFTYLFVRYQTSALSDNDRSVLEAACKDVMERFKCTGDKGLTQVSEAYLDRFGAIPQWSFKWLQKLAGRLRDESLRNYILAVIKKD